MKFGKIGQSVECIFDDLMTNFSDAQKYRKVCNSSGTYLPDCQVKKQIQLIQKFISIV